MLEFLQYGFVIRGLLAGIIVASIAPFIGIFLVLRRYSLIADTLSHVSFAGIAIGFLFGLYTIVSGLIKGPKAPANPWGAKTLEWQTESPPIMHNFDHDPVVTAGPYEYK